MQWYEFVLNDGMTVNVYDRTMVRALKRFKCTFGDMEHTEVHEYRGGKHVGGIEKVGDKWAVYVIQQ
jgi:L-ascorbate metabolism protein UlaG (beta-lactamase superfamily)